MARVTISDLSPEYQRQALEKAGAAAVQSAEQKQNKYRNRYTVVNGIRFASRKEADRYVELRKLEACGRIRNLQLQRQFTLVEGFRDARTGKAVRALRYVADFVYEEPASNLYFAPPYKTGLKEGEDTWRLVVEDTKGRRTRTYIDKKKLMFDRFHIRIRET